MALAATVTGALYLNQLKSTRALIQVGERQSVRLAVDHIRMELAAVRSDLFYLTDQVALAEFTQDDSPSARKRLTEDYLAFVRHKRVYDQIRLLGPGGAEVVRVDWNDGQPVPTRNEELDDHAASYFVETALELDRGEMYISRLDLTVRYGRLEQPLNPTIRFATPVFGPGGYLRGLLVLNYRGQRLLDRIRSVGGLSGNDLWMLNEAGYWLVGPSPEDEWGFLYSERRQRTVARRYPDAWTRMQESPTGGQWSAGGELFTYQSIEIGTPAAASETAQGLGRRWWIVAHVPASAFAAETEILAKRHLLGFVVLAVPITAVAWVLAVAKGRRRRAEQAVRSSETQLRELLEAAPDAVVISNSEGRIVLVNAQAEAMLGYRRDELIGQPVEVLLPERFRQRHVGHRANYRNEPRPRAMGEGLELSARRKDGSEFPVSISLSPVNSDSGMMVFSDIRDVTEQREAEQRIRTLNQALETQNRELQTVNAELEAFSYSVSHDLRAPLRAIDGFSQALLEDYRDRLDDAGTDYLGRVRAGAQRMGRLIDDLLALSRVARATFHRQEVDLSAVAHEVVQELRAAEPQRQVAVDIEPGLRARADPELVRVLLVNLLGNAWKFTGQTPAPQIVIGRTIHDGHDAFFVRDNGAGFDMTYADRLFGAFQRLHDATEFPGTGIGLATVLRIVHRHGGRIWAEGRVGEGAAFYFTLPFHQEDTGE